MELDRIPDLNQFRQPAPDPETIRAMPGPFGGLARHLEADGTYVPDKVMRNNETGQMLAVPHRSDYVDAEELVELLAERLLPRIFDMLTDLLRKE